MSSRSALRNSQDSIRQNRYLSFQPYANSFERGQHVDQVSRAIQAMVKDLNKALDAVVSSKASQGDVANYSSAAAIHLAHSLASALVILLRGLNTLAHGGYTGIKADNVGDVLGAGGDAVKNAFSDGAESVSRFVASIG